MALPDEVRRACSAIAAHARSVRIDLAQLDTLIRTETSPPPALAAEHHYLDGAPADVATYLLTLDAINFGSGWFPTLRKRAAADGRPLSGYFTVASALAQRFRAVGPWTNGELRAMRADEVADVLGQPPDHELMALYAQGLRELGRFLGARHTLDVVGEARGSAQRLAELLATGMTMWHDAGFFKRAQIAPSDLALAGVAGFSDLEALTIFADNLVPHVLRCDGVLVYDERLAAHIDAGRPLRMGSQEREIRACAVVACAQLAAQTGMTEREVDNLLWTRGQEPAYKARPRHRCRTVYY